MQTRPDPKVRWTESFERKREPSLGDVTTMDPLPSIDDAWRRVRELHLAAAERWKLGQKHADESHRALTKAVDASFASKKPPAAGSLTLEIEAARGAMLSVAEGVWSSGGFGKIYGLAEGEGDALMDFWCAHAGLAFTVQALLRAEDHRRYAEPYNFPAVQAMWLAKPDGRKMYGRPTEPWRRLRRYVAAAEFGAWDNYHEVCKAIEAAWPALSLRDKAAVAYAFPSQRAWSEAAADEGVQFMAANRVAMMYAAYSGDERLSWLLYSLQDRERAKAIAQQVPPQGHRPDEMLATLLWNLGAGAVDPLIALLRDQPPDGPEGETWLRTMTAIESEEVATWLAKNLKHKHTNRAAGKYFQRFPHLAAPALKDRARRGSKEAALLLAAVDRSRAQAGEASGAAATNGGPASPDEASVKELPGVLVTPPWLAKKRAPAPVTVLSIEPRALASRLDWSDEERADDRRRPPFRIQTAERDIELEESLKNSGWGLKEMTDAGALRVWRTAPAEEWTWLDQQDLRYMLARFDTAALPGAIACVRKKRSLMKALDRVVSNDVVEVMADAAWRLKAVGKIGEAWLLRYAKEAAMRLVPAAVGPKGDERSAAEHALRFLDARQQGEVVRAVAQTYGHACAKAIGEMLSAQPDTLPARMPKLPTFWAPVLWPRPKLAGSGKALPPAAIDHLGVMLAASPLDRPLTVLAEVKAACEPESLASFAWGLFEAWRTAGSPPKEAWAFHALGHLGTSDTARQLEPVIRAWPSENGLMRATAGLDILAMIGTDEALSMLHGIAQKVKSRPLQQRAAQRIQDVAERRGLSGEQLADRLVPTLDFDATGTRLLDFGGRQFRVGLDQRLKPEVRTLTGQPLRVLPRPGRDDDPELAAAAVENWKAMKKVITAVVPAQVTRLERAMCASRRWSVDEFRSYIVDHPLVGHLARRLIWTARVAAGAAMTFRVAEDRTFADPSDAPFTLPSSAEIGLMHPIECDAETLAAWAERVADYEIVEPFPQLGRRVCHATAEELQSHLIERVNGQTVNVGRVLALNRHGWERASSGDGGVSTEAIKRLAHVEGAAYLSFEPGVAAYNPTEFAQQKLGKMWLVHMTPSGLSRDNLPMSALDRITMSELLADLESLVA